MGLFNEEFDETDAVCNRDYNLALKINRENYEETFQRYFNAPKDKKEHLIELLDLQSRSGRIIANMKAMEENSKE